MVELPLIWKSSHCEYLSPSNFIYGFHCKESEQSYALYVTNFKNVWVESLTGDQLLKKAASFGLERLSKSQVKDLLESLSRAIEEKEDFEINEANISSRNDALEINFRTEELTWPFRLVKESDEDTVGFLSSLNFQLFSIQNLLNYKIADLQRVIKKKDYFIKFLSENFKSSHGDELIRKFRKNHSSDIKSLDPYNENIWNRASEKSYLRNVDVYLNKGADRLIWDLIDASLKHKDDWSLANYHLNKPKDLKIHSKPDTKLENNYGQEDEKLGKKTPGLNHLDTNDKPPLADHPKEENKYDITKKVKSLKPENSDECNLEGEQKPRVIRKIGMMLSPNKKKRRVSK